MQAPKNPCVGSATRFNEMNAFLKENWLWIVLPVLLAFAVIIFLVYFFGVDDTAAQPFTYNV